MSSDSTRNLEHDHSPFSPALTGAARFPCAQCGAALRFSPGTDSLVCPFCGHANAIPPTPPVAPPSTTASLPDEDEDAANFAGPVVRELHLEETLASLEDHALTEEHLTVKCDACAAEVTKPPNVTAWRCPFCDSPIVSTAISRKGIKPGGVLPFHVTRDTATGAFRGWLTSRWFAPNALKHHARLDDPLDGLYLPHWTYDCRCETDYVGQRGDHYYVSESYTTTVNGKRVTRTRQVQRTRWRHASGHVRDLFDDVLIVASRSLPGEISRELEPWDLLELVPYADAYLAGFVAESYQLGLRDGFEAAKLRMRPTIESSVRHDIGGDVQRIHEMNVEYTDMTFKHVLLPVWLSSYRYRGKLYRFAVNARTGEVVGQRPYSAWKIALAVVAGLAVIAVVVMVILASRGPTRPQQGRVVRVPTHRVLGGASGR